MHHYTISIGITQLPESPQMNLLARSLWEVKIPSVAFDSEVVLKALLGISAWHLWAVNPDDQKMKVISRKLFGDAIRLQRAALEQKDTQQLIPRFIAGMIIAHHSWLLSSTDGYSPRLQLETFYLCNGYRTLGKRLPPGWSEYAYLGEVAPQRIQFESKGGGEIMQEGVQDSNCLLETVQNMEIELKVKAVYCKVITELLSMYGLVTSDNNDVSTKEYFIVSFLHRVPWSFINLLQNQDPLAMGLLARVWALLAPIHKVSTAWYIHGAGQSQVYMYSTVSISTLMPDDWVWIMDWPLQIISNYGT